MMRTIIIIILCLLMVVVFFIGLAVISEVTEQRETLKHYSADIDAVMSKAVHNSIEIERMRLHVNEMKSKCLSLDERTNIMYTAIGEVKKDVADLKHAVCRHDAEGKHVRTN